MDSGVSNLFRWRIENLDTYHRAKITTWLVDQRRLGNTTPMITSAVVDATEKAPPLTVDDRAERLLRFLAQETENLGEIVEIAPVMSIGGSIGNNTRLNIAIQAMARSESVGFEEVPFLLDYLEEVGWIRVSRRNDQTRRCTVTVAGYRRIAEQEVNPSSDQAFVAMWFDPTMDEARDKGILPAIWNTGYRPLVISEKPDVDKIDDEIIGEIRRSRFLVADFTHGDKGARGGVYYEAGFALGLGLQVIRSCKKHVIERNELHFDVRQHHHIVWETADELRVGLEARIRALLPDGPHRENIPPRNDS